MPKKKWYIFLFGFEPYFDYLIMQQKTKIFYIFILFNTCSSDFSKWWKLIIVEFCVHAIKVTAWKVSVFGVFLVRIQSECGKIRTRKTPNIYTFFAVGRSSNLFTFFSLSNPNTNMSNIRSRPPDVFLGSGVLKVCSKFTVDHPEKVKSVRLGLVMEIKSSNPLDVCLSKSTALRKKCSYSELLWSPFSCIPTECGEIRSI